MLEIECCVLLVRLRPTFPTFSLLAQQRDRQICRLSARQSDSSAVTYVWHETTNRVKRSVTNQDARGDRLWNLMAAALAEPSDIRSRAHPFWLCIAIVRTAAGRPDRR